MGILFLHRCFAEAHIIQEKEIPCEGRQHHE